MSTKTITSYSIVNNDASTNYSSSFNNVSTNYTSANVGASTSYQLATISSSSSFLQYENFFFNVNSNTWASINTVWGFN